MRSPANRCSGSGAGEEVQTELFERPAFSPLWPKRATKAARTLELLLAGRKITHRDFIDSGDGWRLAAYIHELKEDMGWWAIRADEIPAPTPTCQRRFIALYSLPDWAIREVGAI